MYIACSQPVPICWAYFANQHAGPHLWYFGQVGPLRWLSYAGMALAFALQVGGVLTPSPAGRIPVRGEPRGALRITRHPTFMAAGLFGLLHLAVANVNAAELAFFAGFPLFAALGAGLALFFRIYQAGWFGGVGRLAFAG